MDEMRSFISETYGENSLEHYGIKGMKWGVRRTPEQLGHKRYKAKAETDKYYLNKIDKEKRKMNSAKERHDTVKADIHKARMNTYKAQYSRAKEYVSRMDWDNVSGERKAAGKAVVTSLLQSGAMSAVMLPTIGMFYVSIPNVNAAKRQYRLTHTAM